MEDLNKKLAEHYGFKFKTIIIHDSMSGREFEGVTWQAERCIYPDGTEHLTEPDFIYSLDACFKWLVPRVREHFINKFTYKRYGKIHDEGAVAQFIFFLRNWVDKLFDPNEEPANSLCLLIEKLIDGEK